MSATAIPLYQISLTPHRSLGSKGFKALMFGLVGITLIACLRFLAVGAWPVVLFVAVDIWAIWFAFALSYRSGRTREVITLTPSDLIIEHIEAGGQTRSKRLEPYWARLRLENVDGHSNQLVVRSRKDHVTVGRFLPPRERISVRDELTSQLARWRSGDLVRSAGALKKPENQG